MSLIFHSGNPMERVPHPLHQIKAYKLGSLRLEIITSTLIFTVLWNVTPCRLVSVARVGREVHRPLESMTQIVAPHSCETRLTTRPTASHPWRPSSYPLCLASLWMTWVTTSDDRYRLKSFILLYYGLYRVLDCPWRSALILLPERFTPRMSVCDITKPRLSKREVLAAVTKWRSVW